MITTNVFSRVFHIAWGDSTGTAFAIDHASKQYLVTARHVVKGIDSGDSIRVFHEEQWNNLAVDVVGIGDGDAESRYFRVRSVYRRLLIWLHHKQT